jgi:uncharacterized protein (DUF924 family)
MTASPHDPAALVDFWRAAGPDRWFRTDTTFDQTFRDAYLPAHEAAAAGALVGWGDTAESALALVLLLDQFPRNAFRATPRMYATDVLAREAAAAAIAAGFDHAVEPALRLFFYLPFAHSESLADQERSVTLHLGLGKDGARHALGHRDIVRRFGRFPHRNALLGRTSTPEEVAYLAGGGFGG